MRCASDGKVWMKMLANGNGGSILAQGTAVFIHWPFHSSIRVLRLCLGLVMAESNCAGPFSKLTWGWGPEQPFVLQGVIRGPLMKWKEQGVLSLWSRKYDGWRSWRRTLVPTALVVSQSQQHPDALTPHSAWNLHKQHNQVCGQESLHLGKKQERSPGTFWVLRKL